MFMTIDSWQMLWREDKRVSRIIIIIVVVGGAVVIEAWDLSLIAIERNARGCEAGDRESEESNVQRGRTPVCQPQHLTGIHTHHIVY
jgi:hypothetical protein